MSGAHASGSGSGSGARAGSAGAAASTSASAATPTPPPYAFVTLLTTDAYLPGALVLAQSLRAHHPRRPAGGAADGSDSGSGNGASGAALPPPHHIACLCTPATLRVQTIKALRHAFDAVFAVEPLSFAGIVRDRVEQERAAAADSGREQRYEDSARAKRRVRELAQQNLALLGRPDLGESRGAALTKLHLWRLTAYRRVVYLDADMLVLGDLSHLFYDGAASSSASSPPPLLAAAPDVGWPDAFNSGLLALSPSAETYARLLDFAVDNGSWDGADQGLLNDFFGEALDPGTDGEAPARSEPGDWKEGLANWRGLGWKRLSFRYNVTPNGGYTYAPAYQRYGRSILAAHFIGAHKPWAQARPAAPPPSSAGAAPNDYASLLAQWHAVFDAHYGGGGEEGEDSEPAEEAAFEVRHTDKGVEVVERAPRAAGPHRRRRRLPFSVPTYEAVWDRLGVRGSESDTRVRSGSRSVDELRALFAGGAGRAEGAGAGASRTWGWGAMPVYSSSDEARAYSHAQGGAAEGGEGSGEGEGIYLSLPIHGRLSLIPPPPLPWIEEEKRAMDDEERQRTQSFAMERALTDAQRRAIQDAKARRAPPPPQQSQQQQHQAQQGGDDSDSDGSSPHWSPPQMAWNAALAPPPATSGEESYQMRNPPDAYYANAWDEPLPAHSRGSTGSGGGADSGNASASGSTSGSAFFPTRRVADERIPARLQRQGVFGNLGSDRPDMARVKPVFPWEEAGRAAPPSRVFPEEPHYAGPTAPQPAQRAQPPAHAQQQPQQLARSYSSQSDALGFQRGLPASITFVNAWDQDPTIGKYAEHVRQRTRSASRGAQLGGAQARAGGSGSASASGHASASASGSERPRARSGSSRAHAHAHAQGPTFADTQLETSQDDEGDDESSDGEGGDDDSEDDDETLQAQDAARVGLATVGRRKSWRKQAPSADYHRKAEAYGHGHGHHSASSSPRASRNLSLVPSPTGTGSGSGRPHAGFARARGSSATSASGGGGGGGGGAGGASASGGSGSGSDSPTHRPGSVGSAASIRAGTSPQFTRIELRQMQRANAQARRPL